MATFNWSRNPYFTPQCYVSANAGSDTNDGSKNAPFRTISKGLSMGYARFQIEGAFRETYTNTILLSFFGEPGTVMDRWGSLNSFYCNFYNIKLLNFKVRSPHITNFINTYFGNGNIEIYGGGGSVRVNNCFFYDILLFTGNSEWFVNTIEGSTLISSNITINSLSNASYSKNIYYGCLLTFPLTISINFFNYSLFYNCSFNFNNKGMKTQAQIEEETGLTGIEALRKAYNAAFNKNADVFMGCTVADPLFNAPELGDYTLQPLSPARTASYDSTYIGCYDVAFPTYAFADDTGKLNAFYNASKNQNIIVANNSIGLVRNNDGSAVGNGQITEKPKDLGKIYELKGNRGSYVIADRNGEALDSYADISRNNPIAAGTLLTEGKIYINEIGTVTYNGVIYPLRSRITAVDSIQTFTTTESGVLFEILETPNRFTNEVRFKQNISGAIINAGTNLTANSWYRVVNDTIMWNGKTLPVGDSFQAITGQLSFTGNGAVVEEFSDADVWMPFEIDAVMKVRRIGNVASGDIDAGTDGKWMTNAHREYYSDVNVVRTEFPIYARYVQKRWTLNAGMSK